MIKYLKSKSSVAIVILVASSVYIAHVFQSSEIKIIQFCDQKLSLDITIWYSKIIFEHPSFIETVFFVNIEVILSYFSWKTFSSFEIRVR